MRVRPYSIHLDGDEGGSGLGVGLLADHSGYNIHEALVVEDALLGTTNSLLGLGSLLHLGSLTTNLTSTSKTTVNLSYME